MRIHVIQLSYGDDETVAERVQRVADLVRDQRGADLVVLPELWPHGGFDYRSWPARAEAVDGTTIRTIAAAARDLGAVVHAGSIIERGANGTEGRDLWNTSVLLGADGSTLVTYRKVHRFGFGAGEPRLLEAGTELVTVELAAGGGGTAGGDGPDSDGGGAGSTVVTGLATCYDLRFPEMFRALGDLGVQLVLVPAAWPAPRVEHWTLLGRARALENQCVLVQCNTAGTHAGHAMGGRSQVVGPRGEVLAAAGDGQEVLVVEVDLDDVQRSREQFPVLADRRL